MKRHLLGIIFLIVAFSFGLIMSPIRFDGTAMGHGYVKDGDGSYWIHGFKSMYFVGLSDEGEQYETAEKTKEIFERRLIKAESEEILSQKVLEKSEMRAIIQFQTKDNLQGYCIYRIEEYGLRNICSTSLWHILEFEKQSY